MRGEGAAAAAVPHRRDRGATVQGLRTGRTGSPPSRAGEGAGASGCRPIPATSARPPDEALPLYIVGGVRMPPRAAVAPSSEAAAKGVRELP